MSMNRFYISSENIHKENVVLDPYQSKKIRKVLRLKVGDKIEVFDENGVLYEVELTLVSSKESEGRVLDIKEIKKDDSETEIVLVQALPKNLKVEFIIQKCTELGVSRIIFFGSEFSQVDPRKINPIKVSRWSRIASESAQQCKRLDLPIINLSESNLDAIMKSVNLQENNGCLFWCDIYGKKLSEYNLSDNIKKIICFVGPEGGFSPKEKKVFESSNVNSLKLSDNTLRSETAGMCFLSQLNSVL